MGRIAEKIYLTGTYMLAFFNIVWTFELFKSIVLFVFTMALLIIQIKIHWKRLKKDQEDENPKKN